MNAAPDRPTTPAEAWTALREGNDRFVASAPLHPNQGAERRQGLARGQRPFATLFGCADSRVAAEVIFDQGLGDLFVVRTAGHVVDAGTLGSLEFGAEVLDIPLLVVLGHDSCGAVRAAMESYADGRMPGGFLRDLVERVIPSVSAAYRHGGRGAGDVEREHVRQTMHLIEERSRAVGDRIAEGRLAIVGLVYALDEGRVRVVGRLGDIGDAGATEV